ncbi:MAG: MaoC family dehydratase N-terminal domain-containing protein [Cumulibacter sp.]
MSEVTMPIEASHVLMFARSVGYKDDELLDEIKKDGGQSIYAPPTFLAGIRQFDPNEGLRPKPGESWIGSGKNASGATAEQRGDRGGSLHAEQHYTYHRPVKVGDVLSARHEKGETWTKTGRRGGTLRFSEALTIFEDQNGEPVVTVRQVGVVPEKVVEQA